MHSSRTPRWQLYLPNSTNVNLCYQHARVASKPKGRRAHVRKGKVTARKVSEVLTSIARLIRAVGVLVNALSKWFS